MEVQTVISAKAFRHVVIRSGLYVPDMVRTLRDRYDFIGLPSSQEQEQIDTTDKPLVFTHGKMTHEERGIAVLSLQLFPSGVLVETATSTDDCDVFLDDLLGLASVKDWKSKGFVPPQHLYASQLELTLNLPLEECFLSLSKIGEMIAASFKEYHFEKVPHPFQVHSIGMNIDPTRYSLLCGFRLERRARLAYSESAYFSQAPLRTCHHRAVLEELEKVLIQRAFTERSTGSP
jgi:hypothetical protein